MSRFARRKDESHTAIVAAIRLAGATWLTIESSEAGAPDGAIGVYGRTHLVEIKNDTNLKADALRPNQVAWAEAWKGGPVHLLRSPKDAVDLVHLLQMTWFSRGEQ